MAYITLVSRTATTLTCRVDDLPDWAAGVNWYIGLSTGDMPFAQSRDAADTTWTFDHIGKPDEDPATWTAMEASTLYYVKFVAYQEDGSRPDPAQTDAFATLWEWDSDVSSGADFSMTAAEFNRFVDLIYAVAAAKEISMPDVASDYYVTAGTDMLAAEVNDVRSLLLKLLPTTGPPDAAGFGSNITAAFFDGLVDSLYSIV